MKQKELDEILKKHVLWLRNEPGGAKADLYKADLRGADLSEASLRGADLSRADLSEASLSEADLYKADLRGADLSGADLRGADLSEASLRGADLSGADLSEANLRYADLYKADLSGANLSRADLRGADLSEANLRHADLRGADLRGADLSRAINVPFIPMACPDSGSFIAWKKALSISGDAYLVKLLIPEDARRSSATGRKCRADKAKVLAIEPIEPVDTIADKVRSKYKPNFYYQVGQCITIPDFDTDRFNECAPGIHFFVNRQEAIDYHI